MSRKSNINNKISNNFKTLKITLFATEFMTGVSGAETEERSGPKLGWSGAERERGATERERSGERRSEKSGLMRSGKTFRSAPLTCSGQQLDP